MICSIIAFSLFTDKVVPAFDEEYGYVNFDKIHYGFGWGFSVLIFVFCFWSCGMGFYLVFGGGGFGSFVERCRCRCPGLTFNRMRIGRGEELSVAVSWENDNNNGHVDTGTDGRQDFTIASPTGEGVTSPISFSRIRRCVLKDYFRIV